ncbi:MAG: hypothetical protein NW223_04710 [Hyphomicrobiaceae bacterium]|nr:hypothetical protein [Hyphomicrobiaceae bacterium]
MPRRSHTPEAGKARQHKAMLQLAWRAVIVLIAAYTLAKFFRLPLPF